MAFVSPELRHLDSQRIIPRGIFPPPHPGAPRDTQAPGRFSAVIQGSLRVHLGHFRAGSFISPLPIADGLCASHTPPVWLVLPFSLPVPLPSHSDEAQDLVGSHVPPPVTPPCHPGPRAGSPHGCGITSHPEGPVPQPGVTAAGQVLAAPKLSAPPWHVGGPHPKNEEPLEDSDGNSPSQSCWGGGETQGLTIKKHF